MNKNTILNVSEFILQIVFLAVSLSCAFKGSNAYRSPEAFEGLYFTCIINSICIGVYIPFRLIIKNRQAFVFFQIGMLLFLIYNAVPILLLISSNLILILTAVCFIAAFIIFILKNMYMKTDYQGITAGKKLKLTAGIVLIMFSIIFFFRGISNIIEYLNGTENLIELSVSVSDMIISIIWFVAGLGFISQNFFGKINTLPVFIQASLLFLTLIIFMIINPFIMHSSIDLTGLVIISIMALFFFIPAALLLKGIKKRPPSSQK